MAMQPVDRKNSKHTFKTAPRAKPSLVNRTNKRILADLAPHNVLVSRFQNGWANYNWNTGTF